MNKQESESNYTSLTEMIPKEGSGAPKAWRVRIHENGVDNDYYLLDEEVAIKFYNDLQAKITEKMLNIHGTSTPLQA